MRFPTIVKQIGAAEESSRIYIEDYVYSYLNELKERERIFPLRVALFGHTYKREGQDIYFVYGAACIEDELERGRDEETIRENYFSQSELIGYVNIHGEGTSQAERTSGYCIFYDSNEPMQNYLLSCYNREGDDNVTDKEKEELKGIWENRERRISIVVKGLIQKLLCLMVIVLLAIAVTTIDEYTEMNGFVRVAAQAVSATDIRYKRVGE